MPLVCPDCLGTLARSGDNALRCTTHGGTYELLFLRQRQPAPEALRPAVAELESPAGATCITHPEIAAIARCGSCGQPLCATCGFPQPDGTQRCPDCALRLASQPNATETTALPSARFEGLACVQHPQVQATAQCIACGAYMCSTCDFALESGEHYCPSCATAPRQRLSPRRRRLLGGAYALAAWCTLLIGGLLGGAFESLAEADGGEVLGMLLLLILLVPSAIGLGLALSARSRRGGNSPLVWLAVVWNGLVLGSFLLFCLIGALTEL